MFRVGRPRDVAFFLSSEDKGALGPGMIAEFLKLRGLEI